VLIGRVLWLRAGSQFACVNGVHFTRIVIIPVIAIANAIVIVIVVVIAVVIANQDSTSSRWLPGSS
jgi:hypothetical protein